MMDKKLKKLKMPAKAAPEKEMMAELMDEYEGSPEDTEADMEGAEKLAEEKGMDMDEMDLEPAEATELAALSDDELMAEIKKRGLMGMMVEDEEEMPS